jgi:predicted membrane protein (TIGR00267 family)
MNPRQRFAKRVDDFREYERIAGFWEIARRALANNAFDGILTTIGVLMGSYVAGVRSSGIVVRTGIATSIAMGISGMWGAYLAESAERGRDLAELEKLSLTELGSTKIGRASRVAVIVVSAVDGLAPFVSSMIVLIPMLLAPLLPTIILSYVLSIAVALASLFVLGLFLGSICERNLVSYGLKTVLAGVVCIGVTYLLGGPE